MKRFGMTSVMLVLVALFLVVPLHAQNLSGDALRASAPSTAVTGDHVATTADVGRLDPVIYDNGVTPNTGLSSQLDTVYPLDSQVADDFLLPLGDGTDYGVTGISFTGLYFNTPPDGDPTFPFNVLFYADDGTGLSPVGGPTDPTGSAIAARTLADLAPVGAPNNWAWVLDWTGDPVVLSANTQYWVAVQQAILFPPQFGWEGDNLGGNAVQGFPLLAINYWTTVGTEMNFQLHGTQPVPVQLQSFNVE